VLKFDQSRTVDTITIVNAHNPTWNDRGTKEFKVYLADSENGPWTEVVHDILDDNEIYNNILDEKINATEASVPPQYFQLPKPTCGQYVRFQIISWYGNGGGLQYFSTCPLKCEDEYDLYLNKCYQLVQPQNDISWNDANFECNNRGGQLASIPNAEINDHISTLLTKETFIGLVKDGTADDEWAWTDGSPFDYVNFSPGQGVKVRTLCRQNERNFAYDWLAFTYSCYHTVTL